MNSESVFRGGIVVMSEENKKTLVDKHELDDIWFLTNFDKSKLYWLKEFGCSVSDEGISTEEY